ncbi:MAG TPA: 3-deoxy-7-phosphoheptulonate synthase [Nitrospinota bacterium]|nr:3-deoxy-7-phosphoheptulonate synthase [Anaerolineaceae bacterium]HJM83008.1 3-deoxy-7-phosphoheptulonate synthase [Nitrospinota bacterium]|tara:strand:- start:32221 stop:33237 length:1017 start_codon:yes stop_codon:yes gene_type:complete
MIIVMQEKATKKDIDDVVSRVEGFGYQPMVLEGALRKVVAAMGDGRDKARLQALESLHHVESVMPILKPYKLCSREIKCENTVVDVKGVKIGGNKLVVIAGPCSVEGEEQLAMTGSAVKKSGASILRGGAYKPRTSPYSFQGMEEDGLKILRTVSDKTGMPIVTEVMNPREVDLVYKYTDVIQIGARNVQNFSLLKEVGKLDKPILLKRGLSTTIEEWLMSAEYILSEGNQNVILCERGIRTFEKATRNTLDLSAVPVVKELTHLPIIVDPSHGVGYWQWVGSMSKAAVAAGADGLMIEVHWKPEEAFSDGPQSLKPKKFDILMGELKAIANAVGKEI